MSKGGMVWNMSDKELISLIVFVLVVFVLGVGFGERTGATKTYRSICEYESGGKCTKVNDHVWSVDDGGKVLYWFAPLSED